jgi:hypothetical protein
MWRVFQRLEAAFHGPILSSMLCTLAVLANTSASALAGSQLFLASSGNLITSYDGLGNNGLNVNTQFTGGSGTSAFSSIQTSFDGRGTFGSITQTAIEFDLSSNSGSVQSAILSLYVSGAFVNGVEIGTPDAFTHPIAFSGAEFAGTGQVTQTSFAPPGAGGADASIDPKSNFNKSVYVYNINVTSFVNQLISQGDQFAGFSLSTQDITTTGPIAIEFATADFLQPTLTINGPAPYTGSIEIASLPEPSSYVMFSVGFVLVAVASRWQRRRGSPLRHTAS